MILDGRYRILLVGEPKNSLAALWYYLTSGFQMGMMEMKVYVIPKQRCLQSEKQRKTLICVPDAF